MKWLNLFIIYSILTSLNMDKDYDCDWDIFENDNQNYSYK